MIKFGEKFIKIWPEECSNKLTEFTKKLLSDCSTIEKPSLNGATIADMINASSKFPIEFGTNTCRIQNQTKERYNLIESQLASAYPVIHERVLFLYLNFLEYKSQYGKLHNKHYEL